MLFSVTCINKVWPLWPYHVISVKSLIFDIKNLFPDQIKWTQNQIPKTGWNLLFKGVKNLKLGRLVENAATTRKPTTSVLRKINRWKKSVAVSTICASKKVRINCVCTEGRKMVYIVSQSADPNPFRGTALTDMFWGTYKYK